MGNKLVSSIEIQAPPSLVRATLLDFPKVKEWSEWAITNKQDPTSSGDQTKKGDTLSVVMPANSFSPVVQENKPELFAWLGSIPFIFTGRHEFRFDQSTTTKQGTTFTQSEQFTGAASFMMNEGWSVREKTAANWAKFNQDLKAEAERRAAAL